MNSLKVGSMVVGQYFETHTYLNGMEGILLEDLGSLDVRLEEGAETFQANVFSVEWDCGQICCVMKANLKAKIPPQNEDDGVSGEDIVMNMFKECEEML